MGGAEVLQRDVQEHEDALASFEDSVLPEEHNQEPEPERAADHHAGIGESDLTFERARELCPVLGGMSLEAASVFFDLKMQMGSQAKPTTESKEKPAVAEKPAAETVAATEPVQEVKEQNPAEESVDRQLISEQFDEKKPEERVTEDIEADKALDIIIEDDLPRQISEESAEKPVEVAAEIPEQSIEVQEIIDRAESEPVHVVEAIVAPVVATVETQVEDQRVVSDVVERVDESVALPVVEEVVSASEMVDEVGASEAVRGDTAAEVVEFEDLMAADTVEAETLISDVAEAVVMPARKTEQESESNNFENVVAIAVPELGVTEAVSVAAEVSEVADEAEVEGFVAELRRFDAVVGPAAENVVAEGDAEELSQDTSALETLLTPPAEVVAVKDKLAEALVAVPEVDKAEVQEIVEDVAYEVGRIVELLADEAATDEQIREAHQELVEVCAELLEILEISNDSEMAEKYARYLVVARRFEGLQRSLSEAGFDEGMRERKVFHMSDAWLRIANAADLSGMTHDLLGRFVVARAVA